jgi:hypothetical protein
LSTDERIGVRGSPVGGQVVSFSPVRWSYQLKYWPLPGWRSIPSSESMVRDSRATASRRSTMPSSRATSVLHMYAPMLVVEVWTLRVPSAARMSAGSPDRGSVMASKERQVSAA